MKGRHDERERRVQQLQHALDSRVVIEQAKVAPAERRAITQSAAFDIIRRYARANRRKIHDVPGVLLDWTDHLVESADGTRSARSRAGPLHFLTPR